MRPKFKNEFKDDYYRKLFNVRSFSYGIIDLIKEKGLTESLAHSSICDQLHILANTVTGNSFVIWGYLNNLRRDQNYKRDLVNEVSTRVLDSECEIYDVLDSGWCDVEVGSQNRGDVFFTSRILLHRLLCDKGKKSKIRSIKEYLHCHSDVVPAVNKARS